MSAIPCAEPRKASNPANHVDARDEREDVRLIHRPLAVAGLSRLLHVAPDGRLYFHFEFPTRNPVQSSIGDLHVRSGCEYRTIIRPR